MIDSYDVLVVGAGPAGTAAALRAAELGARVGVVESGPTGGTCVNTGCVPTRVLAKTARLMREVRTADAYGISVTEQHIDWPTTVARVRATVDRVRAAKDDTGRFAEAGVDLLRGRARFVSPHELDVTAADDGDVRRVRAERVILCVGGHSRRLPVPGAELATMPEDVLDLPDLPRRVAVVGAGNTGAQLVTIFNAFGSDVTLLEVAPRILAQTDADVSAHVEKAFREQGVRVEVGVETVDGLERVDDGIRLSWRAGDGGGSDHVVVDAVVMSTGWPAAIEDLGLEAAGVEAGKGRIPVDEYLATNVGHVYVAGDANGIAMLVQAANAEAEAAARNAVLGTTVRTPHHLLPAGGFTDPDYADVGLTEDQARERDEHCVVALVELAELERPVIDDRPRGFLKLVADRRREYLLGAHAVGENAVEVIQSVTTAMAAGVDVATLAKVEFAYPTYSAAIGVAARRLLEAPSVR
ncbi:dihydrolipoyl dehydrogenase family protein [Cellulomonas carbonis]|uniref:Pyridine nucleotide-disulfide oxidoreductase n=1 Tax=Cellulomonas carbonis T26 TaxID=947969 RepID=A0A0A0BXW8_9CELL|nr:NAD(P)/FAD-dependent oxidoreductase [Cellulomonas carbonis]KGM12039.1 pyridine nucleotide-disulfide oxidoreductase [Cellulomonas carbonis T26]GGC07948.1 mercuric reductase [Cellulomonas carbonis]